MTMKSKLKMIYAHFGRKRQERKWMEELAELIAAIAKGDREHVLEEMADVLIMMREHYDNNLSKEEQAKVLRYVSMKVDRTISRIAGGFYD